jgi:hypothetical protein
MTRFFAFGCSFTRGLYPTWADIVARQYDHYQNWAQPGAGNSFIFYSLMECHKRNTITKDDIVIIMWSSIGREDRYVGGEWVTPGSIYNQTEYDATFVNKFADPTGYLLRDSAHLAAAKQLLDNIGCLYTFFSIVPFNVPDDNVFKIFTVDHGIKKLYQQEFDCVRPSVYETVFGCDWYSKPGPKRLKKLQEEYEIKRGDEWPTWEKFAAQDWQQVPAHIKFEINEQNNFGCRHMIRYDTHPTPAEYLEYLQKVAPEIEVDSETMQWVSATTDAVFDNTGIEKLWKPAPVPERF